MARDEVAGRRRGRIEELPSGTLRVRVYAGLDPLTGQRRYLSEVVQAGPGARKQAERVRTKLLRQVDEGKQPRTRATMSQLLDRYLELLHIDPNTISTYRGYVENHIRPALGSLAVSAVTVETLDSFYSELRRCRRRCRKGASLVDHRVRGPHDCDQRCAPHVCSPLAVSTVRQIHWVLASAFDRAIRWGWVSVTPAAAVTIPSAPKPNPQPPTPAEAAKVLNEAWEDFSWGLFLWLAMTVGARRGELCALRRGNLDVERRILRIPSSVTGSRRTLREKDTKTHQQRRVGLDEATVALLVEHLALQDADAAALGLAIAADAFLFSADPDCGQPWLPDSVTQRYGRMVSRLGITTTLHKLRHYNATELIAAGVDLRTVAHRLGHGGGGVTTLRVYAAWVESADHAAAATIVAGLPGPSPRRSG